jgi:hypothetical protein
MPQFRIRVELFKGQKSIELSRLSSLPEELTKLFKSIADDAGVPPGENQWRATNFADGSLEFTALSSDQLTANTSKRCARIANAIFAGDPRKARDAGVTERTLLQYASLARNVKSGETVCLGAFRTAQQQKPTKLYPVTAERVDRLTSDVRPVLEYHGEVLGFIHALYVGSDRPHFDLRDIAREDIVKCYFRRDLYSTIVTALTPRERRVHVVGTIHANRLNRSIESITVERIELVSPLSEDELEQFYGSAPDITGGRTSEEFISDARDDEH